MSINYSDKKEVLKNELIMQEVTCYKCGEKVTEYKLVRKGE